MVDRNIIRLFFLLIAFGLAICRVRQSCASTPSFLIVLGFLILSVFLFLGILSLFLRSCSVNKAGVLVPNRAMSLAGFLL